MSKALANVSTEQILGAFVHHYTPPDRAAKRNAVEGGALIETLRTLPALSTEDQVDTVHVQLQKHHPGLSLTNNDHALISFVDDAFTEILKRTDLDFKVESYVRDLAPHVVVIALEEGIEAITREQEILSLLDTIMRECIG